MHLNDTIPTVDRGAWFPQGTSSSLAPWVTALPATPVTEASEPGVTEGPDWIPEPAWRQDLSLVFGIDLRTLAAFRIGLALLLLGDLAFRSLDVTAFYTDAGTLPRVSRITLLETGDTTGRSFWWSLHMISGQAWFQGLLFGVAAVAAAALLVGYRTWLAACVSWVLLVSVHHRNPMILQGGDVLLRQMALWGMFLPLGAWWSFDRLIHPRQRLPQRVLSIATIALLVQVAGLYVFSVVHKNHPRWHDEYSAVYYAMHVDQLTTSLGRSLLQHPELCRTLTAATYYFELIGPFLAFMPFLSGWFRFGIVLAFWGMHLAMSLCLNLGPFPYYCYVGWLAFVPGCVWDTLRGRLTNLRSTLHQFALRARAAWFQYASPRVGPHLQPAQPWLDLSMPARVLGVLLLVIAFVWNAREVTSTNSLWWRVMPIQANFLGRMTGVEQRWDMFAPPLTEDGWYCMRGTLKNGEVVNLWSPGAPLPRTKPADIAAMYPRERWRKYLMNLCSANNHAFRVDFLHWLARRWNERYAVKNPGRTVLRVELWFYVERTPPPGEPFGPVEPLLLADWNYGPIPNSAPAKESDRSAPNPQLALDSR